MLRFKKGIALRGNVAYTAATMQELDDDGRKDILGEALMDELKVIREYLADIPIIKQTLAKVEARLEQLEADMVVIKAIAKEHSVQLDNHEVRIRKLERVR